MAGASGLERLEEEITMLADGGATAIELGIPFSDPVADGPTIQQAGLRALEKGVTLEKVIQKLSEIHSPVPLILMGYANLFFHYGFEKLIQDLEDTDVKGLIIPDIPYEHRFIYKPLEEKSDIAFIQLVSLTSSQERILQLVKESEGFIYAVTVNGTTGVNQQFGSQLHTHLSSIVQVSPIPVLAGFGISKQEHVEVMNQSCDGVIIGSLLVDSLEKNGVQETRLLLDELLKKNKTSLTL